MIDTRFDIKRMNMLKDILLQLNNGAEPEAVRTDVENYFKDVSLVDVLLTENELIHQTENITIKDVKRLSSIHPHLYETLLTDEVIAKTSETGHPVQIFREENKAFQTLLKQINLLFDSADEKLWQDQEIVEELKQCLLRLGEFHKHYHRKEKLFFPVLERYGYLDPARIIWRGDDRIRALYAALKRQTLKLPDINMKHMHKTYLAFEAAFNDMIFLEEALMLPVLQTVFHRNDWADISEESSAFGYALIEEKEWIPVSSKGIAVEKREQTAENLPFGGGFLTSEEADLILNSLPLEITYVDKNSVFKYFNKMTEASEMMLVRTPISIGRNVANCHPPKSLKKVMTLVRDLKTKKRTSESMWFKKERAVYSSDL